MSRGGGGNARASEGAGTTNALVRSPLQQRWRDCRATSRDLPIGTDLQLFCTQHLTCRRSRFPTSTLLDSFEYSKVCQTNIEARYGRRYFDEPETTSQHGSDSLTLDRSTMGFCR